MKQGPIAFLVLGCMLAGGACQQEPDITPELEGALPYPVIDTGVMEHYNTLGDGA